MQNKNLHLLRVLIGNKADLRERQVGYEEANQYAIDKDYSYIETSAKNSTNVIEVFKQAVELICQNFEANKWSELDNYKLEKFGIKKLTKPFEINFHIDKFTPLPSE